MCGSRERAESRPGQGAGGVTDLGRYIVEEWTEEYREGRLGRRELFRRIALFAGGAAGGTGVLRGPGIAASAEEVAEAASLPPGGDPPAPLRAFAPVVSPDDPSGDARMVTFPLGAASVIGYLARPRSPARAPGVNVIYENRGLLDHHKDVTRRLARAGYVALAPDLASPGGGTERFSDPAEVTALLGRTPPEELVAMAGAGVP